MSGNQRICLDCRWCDWPEFATGDRTVMEIAAVCFHPRAKATTSVVSGTGYARPCSLMRGPLLNGAAVCGPLGLLWEARGQAVTP